MRILDRLFSKTYTIEELSEKQIVTLRRQGAKIGENVDILSSSIEGGAIASYLKIGNNVTITGARILLHDASMKKSTGFTKVGRVEIGDNVFVGIGTIVLPNTRIGSNVIIGRGTVVAKDVPDNVVIAGNPFRVISSYDAFIDKQKKMMEDTVCVDKTIIELDAEENKEDKERLLSVDVGFVR